MLHFIRTQQFKFSILLTVIFSIYATGCIRIYKRSTVNVQKAVTIAKDPIQFYVLDESFPNDFAWQIDNAVLGKSGLTGEVIRLTKNQARDINHWKSDNEANKSLNHVLLYVNNAYANTLFDSTKINFSFDQVTRTEIYKLDELGTAAVSVPLIIIGGVITAAVLIIIIGIATGSCPVVYADIPGGAVLEGEPFVGATHPQLERQDWLSLTHLKHDGDFYKLRMVNEAAEIQHINLTELLIADHPAGLFLLFDKYGKLHTFSSPESPEMASDLVGKNVKHDVYLSDNQIFTGNSDNTSARAEDGLDLTFRRPSNAKQGKLILRARNSVWLDYAHESLQRELGEYGPKIRQKFLEKDSAELQQWALEQNIPLSVWLEILPGKWERVDFFNLAGAVGLRNDVLQLDLSKIKGDQVHIKLTSGFHFWEIDYVAMDFSADQPVPTKTIPLATATDQFGIDLKQLLRTDDNQYYVQPNIGNEAFLSFPVPPLAKGVERTVWLHTKGYYQIQREAAAGKPSRRYLKQFTKADAFPKYSRGQWNDWISRDTIWVASQH